MPRIRRRHLALASLAVMALAATIAVASPSAKPEPRQGLIAYRQFLGLDHSQGAIFTIDPARHHGHQITHPPAGGFDDQPSWRPDGRRIVFTRQPGGVEEPDIERAFWTVKPDGSDAKVLSPPCSSRCRENEQKSQPAYSPDGSRISFNWAAGPVREDIGTIQLSELYVMNADGSDSHPLTHFTRDEPYSGDTGNAAWSPDGRRLVFERVNSPAGHPAGAHALFVIGADGQGLRQLTEWSMNGGGRSDWSSDGARILFRTIPPDNAPGGDIYTVRPDGSGLRRLTRFGSEFQLGELSYSPDAKRIAFTKGGDDRDLYVMRADGSGIHKITRTAPSENWPDWGTPR